MPSFSSASIGSITHGDPGYKLNGAVTPASFAGSTGSVPPLSIPTPSGRQSQGPAIQYDTPGIPQGPVYNYGSASPSPTSPASRDTSYMFGSAQPPATVGTVDAAALKTWCQRIGNKFELKAEQYSDLQQFINLGKNLDTGDLRLRIWQQATTYKVLNAILAQRVEYTAFKSVLNDASKRLATSFKLSKDQMDQILITSKDLTFQPDRMEYMTLHLDVETYIRNNAAVLGFSSVIGDPVREKALRAGCKAKASSARNQYRGYIAASIKGPKMCNLETATFRMAEKLKRGGPGANLRLKYQLHVVILRFYAWDHFYLVPNESLSPEDEREPEEVQEEADRDSEDGTIAPPAKRPRVGGKVKKGQDFWSVMDCLLACAIAQRGKDKKTTDWCTFLRHIIGIDQMRHGKGQGIYMPILPALYTGPLASPAAAANGTADAGSSGNGISLNNGESSGSASYPEGGYSASDSLLSFGFPN
ncbi:hypothetical protein BV22DRAFT_1130378 [Leucogyrophana mollusca]|uniref:Uncharacterized protein n=1 Tax=Leucogyrophana mollusca TaxID=85980 RepID=A0ACB8BG74_9AGAM|nr:hypothetical protein BV22DRAFT_1130378 [Leucogyrophana mollusca]